MTTTGQQEMIEAYRGFLEHRPFPCIGAKAALAREHIHCMVAGNMACPHDDGAILNFLYAFVDGYRRANDSYHSAAILFDGPPAMDEAVFDRLLWQRLQALSDSDGRQFRHDERVSADPCSPRFSFSLKEEAFFIIGLHPMSGRKARQFLYPTLVFNPHAEFERLRETNHYLPMKEAIRKRDIAYSGTLNPMLKDFGERSEVFQYSGRQYDEEWKCPLKINHG